MKTIKFFSIMSLALIFVVATEGFSKKGENPNAQSLKVQMIRYQVNIHLASDNVICNTYWVQILDETGRLVAPAQVFIPGKNQYTFYSNSKESVFKERGTRRVAMLTTNPRVMNLECEVYLFSRSDVKTGIFLRGHTYSFDLYPEWHFQTDKN